jgi:hypothetical protein
MKDNMTYIADGIYLVRTQAGFKKAVKAQFPEYSKRARSRVVGYPTSYPAVVSLSVGYYVICNSVHVNVLKAAIAHA